MTRASPKWALDQGGRLGRYLQQKAALPHSQDRLRPWERYNTERGSIAMSTAEPAHVASMAGRRPWESRLVTYSISAAGRTDRGHRRADNQDRILCETSADGASGLFAVADGMGGQRAGAVASALAIATLCEELGPLLAGDEAWATEEGRAGAIGPLRIAARMAEVQPPRNGATKS